MSQTMLNGWSTHTPRIDLRALEDSSLRIRWAQNALKAKDCGHRDHHREAEQECPKGKHISVQRRSCSW